MGEPEVLLGGLLAAAQEEMGEPTMTDGFDREAYRASLAAAVIALSKAEAGAAVLRTAIQYSVDHAPDMADEFKDRLMDALADTQAGTKLLIRLGQFEHQRDRYQAEFSRAVDLLHQAERQRDKAAAEIRRLTKARAKLAECLRRLAEWNHRSCRTHSEFSLEECPFVGCRENAYALRLGKPKRRAAERAGGGAE